MSRFSRLLTATAIGAFAAHAACADTTEQRLAFGAGPSASCGAWTKARQSKTAQPAEQWVAGYLSGVNTTSDEPDTLIGTDWDGVMAWMDNYCGFLHRRERRRCLFDHTAKTPSTALLWIPLGTATASLWQEIPSTKK